MTSGSEKSNVTVQLGSLVTRRSSVSTTELPISSPMPISSTLVTVIVSRCSVLNCRSPIPLVAVMITTYVLLSASSAGAGAVCAASVGTSKSGETRNFSTPLRASSVNAPLSVPLSVHPVISSAGSASIATAVTTAVLTGVFSATVTAALLLNTGAVLACGTAVTASDQGPVPSAFVART